MVQFRILGPIEVIVAGQPVALGGRRQRTVLARLLLAAGQVVTADRLIDDVWDGRPPATAQKTLQKYVSELRRLVPAGTLRTVGGGYVLEVGHDGLDVRRFERLVAAGEHSAALGLWRGELLADLPDAAFATSERARLDELRLFAIESRITEQLDGGELAPVIAELGELVDAHPLRERLTAMLMLALYRSGRQVEALRVFERHRQYLADEIGVEPDAELRQLESAILQHDPVLDGGSTPPAPAPRRESAGNLPSALTSFVGRREELCSVERAIEGNRLVTLTGPGGVGKTRLAIELGRRRGERFPGGVWMVDLAAVRDPALVAATIATALGVDTRHASDELTAVSTALAHRAESLVVLDNCEHLVESVSATTVALLDVADELHLLATSRRALGVDGEFVRPVHPLRETDAVTLFTERLGLVAEAPEVTTQHAVEICRQLDGLPLAIELAASQLRVMNADEIIAQLGDHLAFRGPASVGSRRQRTLGDMVRWSYDLLEPAVQATFARLGVLSTTFTIEAAGAVAAPDVATRRHALDHLTTLIDHSLVVREHTPGTPTRYRMLETLRLFALEHLAESGEEEPTRRAHAEFYRALAERGGAEMYGPHERSWRIALELEEPNLHAALRWAADHDPVLALRLAVALWPYWEARWRERLGVEYLDDLVGREQAAPADLRAWALTAWASMSGNAGEARRTVPRAIEAVAAQRAAGDRRGLAYALGALGLALGNQGQLDEAERALAEGLEIARQLDDGLLLARLLDRLGFVAARSGDHERGAAINREELEILVGLGSRRGEATALRHLAVSLHQLGDDDEAATLCRRALAIWKDLDDPAAIAHVETTLADIARVGGDLSGATDTYHAALVQLQAIGDRRCTASTFKNLAAVAAARGDSPAAVRLYHDALALRYELGDEAGLAEVLEGLACVDSAEGRDVDAVTLITAATELRRRTGSAASPRNVGAVERALAVGRQRIGDERVRESFASAGRMSVVEIVALTLSSRGEVDAPVDMAG